MRELLAHAKTLGVTVHVAHLPAPYRGFYDAEQRMVVYGFELTPIERVCVLAHELGHAFYDHRCKDDPAAEAAADLYAARLLIDPQAYARAAAVYPHVHGIAEELGVEPRLVDTFQRRVLSRFGERTYSHARMGAGQYVHAWN